MERPPLTPNAIAGMINDADLDPGLAMRELGYRPLPVEEGLRRCFAVTPLPRRASAFAPNTEGNPS